MRALVRQYSQNALVALCSAIWLGCSGGAPSGTNSGAQEPGLKAPTGDKTTATPAEIDEHTPGDQPSRDQSDTAKSEPASKSATAMSSASQPLTELECEAWIDKFLAMAQRDHDKTVDPRYRPTPEQIAEIRVKMGPQLKQACMQLDRATYDCEMRATDRDALTACSAKKPPP